MNRERAGSVVQFDLSKAFDPFDPVFHNVREEGGGGGAPGTVAETPLQPMERTTVEQIFTLQLVKEPTLGQVEIS